MKTIRTRLIASVTALTLVVAGWAVAEITTRTLPSISPRALAPSGPRGAVEGWKLKVGDPFPDFSLPRASGGTATLADYKGKPFVVSFFASWCGPCRAELPHMETDIYQKMKDRGLQVIAVNREEDAATVNAFLKKQPLSFPVLLDEKRELFSKIADQGIPRLVGVGRDGSERVLRARASEAGRLPSLSPRCL